LSDSLGYRAPGRAELLGRRRQQVQRRYLRLWVDRSNDSTDFERNDEFNRRRAAPAMLRQNVPACAPPAKRREPARRGRARPFALIIGRGEPEDEKMRQLCRLPESCRR